MARNALGGIHINGSRSSSVLMMVDGMPTMDAGNNGVPSEPNMDSIAEVRVLVVQEGRLAETKVATGLHNWSFTEITSGLAAGESVVISLDRPEVKAGARVTLAAEAQK